MAERHGLDHDFGDYIDDYNGEETEQECYVF